MTDHTAILRELEDRLKNQPFGGIVTRNEMPSLISIAPVCGEQVKVGQFTITRRRVDEFDQFTISKPLPQRSRCPVCNMRLDKDGSCWSCDNPIE